MREITWETPKLRLIKESEKRYIVEEFVGFWIIGYWQRAEIYLEGLGKGYYSYRSEKEANEGFAKLKNK